jgi:hypothetical protein
VTEPWPRRIAGAPACSSPARAAWLLALILIGWAAGCRPPTRARHRAIAPPPVVILKPPVASAASPLWDAVLARTFPDRAIFPSHEAEQALASARDQRRVLLLPDAEYLPWELAPALRQYVHEGGALVLAGFNPFGAGVRQTADGPTTEAVRRETLMKTARIDAAFPPIVSWSHHNNTDQLRGAVRLVRDRMLPRDAVRVEVEDGDRWDLLESPELGPEAWADGDNTLTFYLRSDTEALRLVVECETSSSARWFAVLSSSTGWSARTVHEREFRRARPEAAGSAESFTLTQTRWIRIGLHNEYAPQPGRDHKFDLSDVRPARDPLDAGEAFRITGFIPSDPRYRFDARAAAFESLHSGRVFVLPEATPFQSSVRLARGSGGEQAAAGRWIPLASARGSDGQETGWPASIFLEPAGDGLVSAWGWVGLQPDAENLEGLKEILLEAAGRLYHGGFLYRTGIDRYSIGPRDELRARAGLRAGWTTAPPMRIVAEWRSGGGDILRRIVSEPMTGATPFQSLVGPPLSLGMAAPTRRASTDFTLRLSLEDAPGKGWQYDVMDQPVKVLESPAPAPPAEWIVPTGSRFTQYKRPLFLLGLNYAPHGGWDPDGQRPAEDAWLEPAGFDPDQLTRELQELSKQGVNALLVSYSSTSQAPQLEYFLEEAARFKLFVILRLTGWEDHQPTATGILDRLEAARIRNRSGVIALDPGWPGMLGAGDRRNRYDADWERWLREQYGSVEQAERVLGALWRWDGAITGPPDDVLWTDGGHRHAVIAYRRFIEDHRSRAMGHIGRALRRQGYRQMLTASFAAGWPGDREFERKLPLDPATGSAHLDFITLDAAGFSRSHAHVAAGAFYTVYARGMSDNKPVVWSGLEAFGGPLTAQQAGQDLQLDSLFQMLLAGYAAGGFLASTMPPPGDPAAADTAMLNPAGLWRLAGNRVQTFTNRQRREKPTPPAGPGREIDRTANPRGFAAVWAKAVSSSAAAAPTSYAEVRPLYLGRRTTDIEPAALGGEPLDAPGPMLHVNAEWGDIQIDGSHHARAPGEPVEVSARRTLTLELLNTGPATWSLSRARQNRTVWVEVGSEERRPQYIEIGTVPFGRSARLAWVASDPGVYVLRPFLWGSGGFGEPLRIIVR